MKARYKLGLPGKSKTIEVIPIEEPSTFPQQEPAQEEVEKELSPDREPEYEPA